MPVVARVVPTFWKKQQKGLNIEHGRACASTGRANLLELALALKLCWLGYFCTGSS